MNTPSKQKIISVNSKVLFGLSYVATFTAYQTPLLNLYLPGFACSLIKSISVLLMVVVLFKAKSSFNINGLVGLYLLMGIFLAPQITYSGFDGFDQALKILLRLLLIPVVYAGCKHIGASRIARVWVIFGAILSIQSVVLYILLFSGLAPSPQVLTRFGEGDYFPSYGILGLGSWVVEQKGHILAFRVQSFFSEANKFALFLIPALFYCPLIRGSVLRSACFLVIVASLVFTFSFTAFVSLTLSVITLIFLNFIRFLSEPVVKRRFIVIFFGLALIITSSVVFKSDLLMSTALPEGETAVSIATSKDERSVDTRTSHAAMTFDLLNTMPLGFSEKILAENGVGKLPSAPIRWAIWGGYPGFFYMLFIQAYIFVIVSLRYLHGKASTLTVGPVIALLLASVVHGNWIDLDYIMCLSIFLLYMPPHTDLEK